jgi:hypothetical protein
MKCVRVKCHHITKRMSSKYKEYERLTLGGTAQLICAVSTCVKSLAEAKSCVCIKTSRVYLIHILDIG